MKHRPGVLALALLLAGATAGCSGSAPNVCPALAWFNSVTVSLDGNAEKVQLLELCADDVCSVRSDGPVRVPETSVSPGAVPAPVSTLPVTVVPAPSASGAVTTLPSPSGPAYSPFTASRIDEHTWRVSLLMRSPKTVTLTAYSADGTVLARRGLELGWTRVGGSEACGGPGTAGPVRLVI